MPTLREQTLIRLPSSGPQPIPGAQALPARVTGERRAKQLLPVCPASATTVISWNKAGMQSHVGVGRSILAPAIVLSLSLSLYLCPRALDDTFGFGVLSDLAFSFPLPPFFSRMMDFCTYLFTLKLYLVQLKGYLGMLSKASLNLSSFTDFPKHLNLFLMPFTSPTGAV